MKRLLIALAALVGLATPIAAIPVAAEQPTIRNAPAPYVDTAGMVHWIGEFERGSDLKHYADWVLDQVGAPADRERPACSIMSKLDIVWLYLTPGEAEKANALTGTAPLVSSEVAGIVSRPFIGGPLAPPGQMGWQEVPAGVRRIGTPVDEWRSAPSSGKVKVAIVDTGIDARHTDLRVVGGANCTDDERGPEGWGIDAHGHSTWIAGRIGAKHNDEFVVGIAPNVALYDAITFSASGSASAAMVLGAVDRALQAEADVINLSLGGSHVPTRCGGPSVYTNGFCKAARQAVLVVAAGNNAQDAINNGPANVDAAGIVTVGAFVDYDGQPGGTARGDSGCGFTHRDDYAASFTAWGSTVDVVAPGGCEISTAPYQSLGFMSGTSMATPHVVGVFAAFMAKFPDCRGEDAVKAVLRYAERQPDAHSYEGWPGGADQPPIIAYVDEEPLERPDPEKPTPCKFQSEVRS